MTKAVRNIILVVALLSALFFYTPDAVAQSNPRDAVFQMNREAMDAYANLQIGQAVKLLEKATARCKKHGIIDDALARTYLNFGVIEAAGNQNNAAALDYFQLAICLDPASMLDPLNATPEMETLFKMAKSRAEGPGGCTSTEDEGGGGGTSIRHQPITQQLRLVPVPVYIEVEQPAQVGMAVLYYRTSGEEIFQQVPLGPYGNGYAAIIGCDVLQVLDPSGIEYYIAVKDKSMQLSGTIGTEAQPYTISIVENLVDEPVSLPGAPPPQRCKEDCPPWNPNCGDTCNHRGDPCDTSIDCCTGLTCEEGACAGKETRNRQAYKPFFRLSLTFGTGSGVVPAGPVEPYNQVSVTPKHITDQDLQGEIHDGSLKIDTAFAWSKFHFRVSPMFYLNKLLLVGVTFRGGLSFMDSPDVMPVAPMGLAVIGFRIVGEDSSLFELDGVVGLGGGIIQHRIPYNDCPAVALVPGDAWYDPGLPADQEQIGCHNDDLVETDITLEGYGEWDPTKNPQEKSFYREAGMFVAEIGLDAYIWITNNFGINIGAMASVYVGSNFALNFDVQLGPAMRF
jgi:hypothetical protein